MKTTGIVADNYKLDKFKKELIAAGFPMFEISRFSEDVSIINVRVEDHQIADITRLCKRVELFFKRSN